jgi:hypothetical protein
VKSLCALCLLLVICITPRIFAQSTDATISGIIVDPSGKLITNAAVQILNEATGVLYTSKSNGDGIYTLSILPPGQYRIEVSKIGFKTLIKPGIVLNVQSAVALNFTLPVGATSESVTVEAGASLINTTDASVSTVIDRKFVGNIPLNGRSFQDLISMTPGVVTQSPQSGSSIGYNGDFSVNGQRTESNYYTVDGVTGNIGSGNGYGGPQSASGGAVGGSTALGTTQSLVSVDALQEFRVASSSYSAEYGRSPGGQFSLATRSGTNKIHGSLFDYLRNNFFDANDWFNDYYGKTIPPLRQNDFGGTAGGPLRLAKLYNGTSRTFFFVSYEGLRLDQPQAASLQFVPSTSLRANAPTALQPLLNAFPLPTGPETSVACSATTAPCPTGSSIGTLVPSGLAPSIAPYSLPSNIDSTSVRLDHTFTPKLTVFFRYGNTPSSVATRALSAITHTRINTQTYTAGATFQLSSNITNDARLGYAEADSLLKGTLDSFGGATPVDLVASMAAGSYPHPTPYFYYGIAGIGSGTLTYGDSRNQSRQWNFVDATSLSMGHHQLKVGVDYRRINSPTLPASPLIDALFYNKQSILNNTTGALYVYNRVGGTPIFNETSVFAQDEWHINERLNLSMGVRWELNPPPTEANGNDPYTLLGSVSDPSSLSLAPQGTPLWKTPWLNFAPRLGVAWTAHNTPGRETVVRAGGGAFFDTDNALALQGFSGVGFSAYRILSGAPLPLAQSQLAFTPSAAPPYTSTTIYAFPDHLQPPYSLQWNVSIQQAIDRSSAATLSYVASNGRRLIGEQQYSLHSLNPNFGVVILTEGRITSNYQALQFALQRSVAHGFQALASYTWSHSLDYGSTGTALPLVRGNSDFDVRHNLAGGLTWDLPSISGNNALSAIANHWGFDGRLSARTGFPITLQGAQLTDTTTGNQYYAGLNLVPNQPIYLYGAKYPGGRSLNKAAFSSPATGQSGDAPRNFARGFNAVQLNCAARREFPLYENLSLQFRAEVFNLLNHPNFGYVDPLYADSTFGQATKMLNSSLGTMSPQYQQGGARSMQFALKLLF